MPDHPAVRTLIVDDEALARGVVREHLVPHRAIEIVGESPNGFEAVKAIDELKPDLVFLDIQMPKLNGFEVLEMTDHSPAVIFVTAYDQFAVQAFEVHAVDYLLKPFSPERFAEALDRALDRIRTKTAGRVAEVLTEVRRRSAPLERILVKEGSTVIVIPAEKIDFIEARDDYAAIRTAGKFHLKQQRLADLETLLDDSVFVRIHRSSILNIRLLARIEPYGKDSKMAVLKDGTQLPVSRAGYEKLKRLL